MGPLEHYFVQPVLDEGTVDTTRDAAIVANSALKAGEAALERPLLLEDGLAAAVGRRLTGGLVPPHSVMLHDPAQAPGVAPAS